MKSKSCMYSLTRRNVSLVLVVWWLAGSRGTASPVGFSKTFLSPLWKVLPALRIRTTWKHYQALPPQPNNDESNMVIEVSKIFQFRFPRLQPIRLSQSFYFGAPSDLFFPPKSADAIKKKAKTRPVALSQVMTETLDELRVVREEMEALRQELRSLKRRMTGVDEMDNELDDVSGRDRGLAKKDEEEKVLLAKRKQRQREFDRLAREIEKWAERLLFREDGEQDGWKEIQCNKLIQHAFNRKENVRAYMKWMKDSRGEHATLGDENEYPCIKVYATIDAPIEHVCAYMAQDSRMKEYNDLIVAHKDLDEISPHSKIVWGLTPQVLFIKPRDFVTFCHHRWLRDGTQVVVNQACEHPDAPGSDKEQEGKACRAYAIRGANYISRHPEDPENKTSFAMLAHACPGGGIPKWACKTAANALAPIEPFKLFCKINDNVRRARPQLEQSLEQLEMVSTVPGRSSHPAGLSQLGYACFWPKGGGLKEGFIHPHHEPLLEPLVPTNAENEIIKGVSVSIAGERTIDDSPDPLNQQNNDQANEIRILITP